MWWLLTLASHVAVDVSKRQSDLLRCLVTGGTAVTSGDR